MESTSSQSGITRKDVAAALRAERARAKVTMDALAARSGVSKSTIIRLEAGTRAATVDQLAAICGVLGIRVSRLFESAEQARRGG